MSKLYSEYLSRKNSLFGLIGDILPDPDRILEENGNDLSIYRALLIDPHLTATVLQRKMQVCVGPLANMELKSSKRLAGRKKAKP